MSKPKTVDKITMTIAEEIVHILSNYYVSVMNPQTDRDGCVAKVQSLLDEYFGKKIALLNETIEFIDKQITDLNLHNIGLMKKLRHYDKPIDECLETVEKLRDGIGRTVTGKAVTFLYELKSKLEAMKETP